MIYALEFCYTFGIQEHLLANFLGWWKSWIPDSTTRQWRIQDFPRGGANPKGGASLWFCKNSPKTAWKKGRNLSREGSTRPLLPLDPPMHTLYRYRVKISDVQEIHHEEKSVHHELVSDVQLIFFEWCISCTSLILTLLWFYHILINCFNLKWLVLKKLYITALFLIGPQKVVHHCFVLIGPQKVVHLDFILIGPQNVVHHSQQILIHKIHSQFNPIKMFVTTPLYDKHTYTHRDTNTQNQIHT